MTDPTYPTIPQWVPTNSGKPSAAELNRLYAPRVTVAAANTSIPITYGRDRQFGRIFFASADPNFLYVGFLFAVGPIEAFETIFVDGVDVNDPKGLLSTANVSRGAQLSVHLGDNAAPQVDPLLQECVANMVPTAGQPYSDTLEDVAYVVIKVPKNSGISGFPRLEAITKGQRVYDPRLDSTAGGNGFQRVDEPATWAYSANPTLCCAHFVTQHVGWEIDWESVEDNANANDQLLPDESKRREIGLTMTASNTASAWVQGFRTYMGAFVTWEGGKLRIIPDRADVDPAAPNFDSDLDSGNWAAQGVAYHFTPDDMVDEDLQLSQRSARNFPNSITVEYVDSTYPARWITDRVRRETPEVEAGTEKRRSSVVQLPGIHLRAQANREAVERLNWFINDLEGTLQVFDEGLAMQIGSIIAITHPIGFVKKLFRVIDLKTEAARWTMSIAEYDKDAYSDEVIGSNEYGGGRDLGATPAPMVTGLTADEELFTYPDSTTGSRVRMSWTAISNASLVDFYVEGYIGTQLVFSGVTTGSSYVSPPVEGFVGTEPVVLTLKVTTRFKFSFSDPASTTTTIAGKTAPPLNLPGTLSATKAGATTVALRWTEPAGNDIVAYEIRRTSTTVNNLTQAIWDAASIVERTKARNSFVRLQPIGTYAYLIKAIDSFDNQSTQQLSSDAITFGVPSPPANFAVNVVGGELRASWNANASNEFVTKYRVVSCPLPSSGAGAETVLEITNALTFSKRDMPVGPVTIRVYAIDEAGQQGSKSEVTLTIAANEDSLNANRDAAIAAEGVTRAAADAAEIAARVAADLQVASDAAAATLAAGIAAANALLNSEIATEAKFATERLLRQTADESLASQISSISAGTGEQFDAKSIWYFDTTTEGWIGDTGHPPTAANGYLRPPNHNNPFVQISGLVIPGGVYHNVKARIKKTGSPTWIGYLYASDGETDFELSIPAPVFNASGVATVDWADIEWAGNIETLQLTLGSQTATNYYEIDWIAVGRPSPGASLAALQEESTARVTGDAAIALQTTTLAAQMRGNYTGNDLSLLTQGLLFSERQARVTADSAMASQILALQASITTAFAAQKSWVFSGDGDYLGWTTVRAGLAQFPTISDDKGATAVTAEAPDPNFVSPLFGISGLQAYVVRALVRRRTNNPWEGVLYWSTLGHGFSGSYLISSTTTPAVGVYEVVEWDLTSVADWRTSTINQIRLDLCNSSGSIVDVQWIAIGRRDVPAASSNAVSVLDTRVSVINGIVDSHSSQLTTLQAQANTSTGLIAGQATAIDGLTARVVIEEGKSSAASGNITALQAALAAQFQAAKAWVFGDQAGTQGWVGANVGIAQFPRESSNGALALDATSNDPNFTSPVFNLGGGRSYIVRAKVRRRTNTSWEGGLFWATTNHGISGSYYTGATGIPAGGGDYEIIEWDLTGNADWRNNAITQIRFDFGAQAGGIVDVEWIAIGTKSNPPSSATATTATEARVDVAEGQLTAQANQLTSLRSTLQGVLAAGLNVLSNPTARTGVAPWLSTLLPILATSFAGVPQFQVDLNGKAPSLYNFYQDYTNPNVAGQQMTFSCDLLVQGKTSGANTFGIDMVGLDANGVPVWFPGNIAYMNTVDAWTRVSCTGTPPSNVVTIRCRPRVINGSGSTFYWRNAKLTLGTSTVFSDDVQYSAATQNLSTRATLLENGQTQLMASFSVSLDVNGYVTGFVQNNNGTSGDMTILVDRFRMVTPGATPKQVFAISADQLMLNTNLNMGQGRILSSSGGYMNVIGVGFGSSNQFVEWFGPVQASLSNCTEANAITYKKVNGAAYFGGSLTAGTLRNAVQTTTTATSGVEVVNGPFSTNGNTRNVIIGFSRNESGRQLLNNPGGWVLGSGSNTATVQVYRKIGTAAETLWQTINVTGNSEVFNEIDGPDAYTRSWGGSITVNDQSANSAGLVQYRAVLTAFGIQTITYSGSGTQFEAAAISQSLGIISVEQ